MKKNMNGMDPKGIPPRNNRDSIAIPPGALESEILAINHAKRSSRPSRNRSKGTIWSKRRGELRHQFNGRERELWSPDFYKEWLEYVEAVENGELSGY
jgi:hypothetical protein